MANRIEDIEGIGNGSSEIFRSVGIYTTDDLLEIAGDKFGRQWLANKIEVEESSLLECTKMADLLRINGVARQYAELLGGVGIGSIKDLKTRDAAQLVDRMKEVNKTKRLVNKAPNITIVSAWIEQARNLPEVITD